MAKGEYPAFSVKVITEDDRNMFLALLDIARAHGKTGIAADKFEYIINHCLLKKIYYVNDWAFGVGLEHNHISTDVSIKGPLLNFELHRSEMLAFVGATEVSLEEMELIKQSIAIKSEIYNDTTN